MVLRQRLLQRAQHLATMLGIVHVDEVDDDDAAQVAQPQLARDRLRRFQVGAEDGFLEVALAEERTRVHVDRGHRLGLVDHQVTARLQRHLLVQRAADLVLHPVQVEDGALARIQFDAFGQHRHVLGDEGLQPLVGFLGIDLHLFHVLADEVAHRAQRQAEVFVQDAARGRFAAAAFDHVPDARQVGDVLGQRLDRLALGIGADDVPMSAVQAGQFGDGLLQAMTLGFVLDPCGHADHLGLRQQHQVARGDADLRGQPRALAADRVFDHLHDDVLPVAQQVHDRRGRRRGQGGLFAIDHGVRRRTHDVVGVQEGGTLQPDFDERRLHARHHPLHLALVDVAHHAAAPAAFDVQFLQHAVLDHRHAGLARGDVDQDLFRHGVLPQADAVAAVAVGWMPKPRSSFAVSCRGRPITAE